MQEVKLTGIKTPDGNLSYREAELIFECKLLQISAPDPSEYYSQEVRDYLYETYKQPADYRKYVFGEITHIWKRKI
jgi:hypothetical protein